MMTRAARRVLIVLVGVAVAVTPSVLAVTTAQARTAAPMTMRKLLSAPVPGLRGNPAGRLRNGVLPDPIPGGSVALIRRGRLAPRFGDFTHDGVNDALAVIAATSGAGGGDIYVELYTGNDRRITNFDPAAATQATLSGSAYVDHADILKMAIRKEQVLIDFYGYRMYHYHRYFRGVRFAMRSGRMRHTLVLHTGVTHSGLWSDPSLRLTFRQLGIVRLGMPVSRANAISGGVFSFVGDGVYYAKYLPRRHGGAIHLDANSRVYCIRAPYRNNVQAVHAPHDILGGDPVSRIRARWGSRAHFVPAPTQGGISNYAGYFVRSHRHTLVYEFNPGDHTIAGVAIGPRSLRPNGCIG
jgi:hypothetical protein